MPEYLVVARAQSGIRIGKDDPLIIHKYPTPIGPVDMLFRTRLANLAGFSKPIPMGLMAEIRGVAPSLDEALQHFSQAAQSICPVLAFIGNSSVDDMAPEISYDISLGQTERDFFQQFLPEERILMVERRRVPANLAVRFLEAMSQHAESGRIHRAVAQYYQALHDWQPGHEVLAFSHLWMSVEALTPVALRRVLAEKGMDRAQLAAEWGIDLKQLDAEVRKRLIMQGDEDTYKKAKVTSDGFEHGFLALPDVHANSNTLRVTVATYLRTAILRELSLGVDDVTTMTQPPWDSPGHVHTAKYVRIKLLTKTENLAAPAQQYPMLNWKTSYRDTSDPNADEVKMEIDESFTGVFAADVAFRMGSIEMWGGQESNLKKAENSKSVITKAGAAEPGDGEKDSQ